MNFKPLNPKAVALAAAIFCLPLPASAAQMTLQMHRSNVVHLERNVTTVIVGNPLIAEASVLDGRLIVIQGRSFGTTDVIALDAQGQEILNLVVTVGESRQRTLALHLGPNTESYACTPSCVRVLRPGDDDAENDILTDQNRDMLELTERALGMSADQ